MEFIFEALSQYGVLGLWTASLIYNNHMAKKNFQERYDNINKEMLEILKENQALLENGLREMREDRLLRMKNSN